MDLDLPVVDGWEAPRRLKADPATRDIPIIALTAHAMVGDREKALAAGCDDCDTKPFEFDRLLAKITRALAKTKSRCSDASCRSSGCKSRRWESSSCHRSYTRRRGG
jgi:CheY-like chemotaxis protein